MIVCRLSLLANCLFWVQKIEWFIPGWLLTVVMTIEYSNDLYQPTLLKKYTEYTREIEFSVLFAHSIGRKNMQKSYRLTTHSVRALTSFTCGIHPHHLPINPGAYLSPALGICYLPVQCCRSAGLQLSYSLCCLVMNPVDPNQDLQADILSWPQTCLAITRLDQWIDFLCWPWTLRTLPWSCLMSWTLGWAWPPSLACFIPLLEVVGWLGPVMIPCEHT